LEDEEQQPDSYFLTQNEIEEYRKNDEVEQKGVQEVRMSNVMYNRIIVVELISVFFSAFSMIMSVMIYEMRSRGSVLLENNEYIFRYYNLFCTFALVCGIYCKYDIYLKWYVSRGILSEHDTVISTGWWKKMVAEQILMLVAPYPFLQGVHYHEYIDAYSVYI
jgi:hypothetical protein